MGHGPLEPGGMYDCRISPNRDCLTVKPSPNNPTGGGTFAASPQALYTGCCVRRHSGCEGRRPCCVLQVAVWLHRLNMAMGGEVLASETLDALRHHQGPLLESFLTPRTSNLTYQEVVDHVLKEKCWASEQSLHHLQGHCAHNWEVLEGLIKAHGELDKADKATWKSLKKEID